MQALYHLQSLWHTQHTMQLKGKQPAVMPCGTAGPGWSDQATGQTFPMPSHTRDDTQWHYFKKQTYLKNCFSCFGARMPPLRASNFTGVQRGVWRSCVALPGATHHLQQGDLQKPNPPLLTCPRNTLLPRFSLHAPRCVFRAEKQHFCLLFNALSGGRTRTHNTAGGWSRGKRRQGQLLRERGQGLTVVVLPSVTSTTAKKKKKREMGGQNETPSA